MFRFIDGSSLSLNIPSDKMTAMIGKTERDLWDRMRIMSLTTFFSKNVNINKKRWRGNIAQKKSVDELPEKDAYAYQYN